MAVILTLQLAEGRWSRIQCIFSKLNKSDILKIMFCLKLVQLHRKLARFKAEHGGPVL